MAQKTTKKRNQVPIRKEATPSPRPWPNLPHQLLGLIARQPRLMQNITSFGGVTKSWRSAPRTCSPDGKPRWVQLVEISGEKNSQSQKNMQSHTIDISFHEENFFWYNKKKTLSCRYQAPRICFIGHSHGYIIWLLPSTLDLNLPFRFATLSSQLEDPNGCNVMALTGISSPAFAFFRYRKRPLQKAWILEDCTLKDPYALNQHMQLTNAIRFQGKFYALSLQGSLVVIEDIDSCFRITTIGASRAVPSKVSRQFREYLMESNGEILLVFLISGKSIDLVEDVEVFQLDNLKLLWVKLESLGDRTVFLEDECCMAVTASKVGCRSNCIYYTHCRVDNWWVFDMETGCISPASGPKTEDTESVMWDEPMEHE
ncbi:hypothetical protein Pfo_002476 [Paulownia fortunei]|nr:hypothetical protein Pfo_002476 [Paulownia fortunei]